MVPSKRIDDEAVRAVGPFNFAALFHEETVAGPRAGKLGMQDFFGAVVGGADEIGRTLERDLKLLDLSEIAREAASGLAGGGEHHIHQRRGGHGGGQSLAPHRSGGSRTILGCLLGVSSSRIPAFAGMTSEPNRRGARR